MHDRREVLGSVLFAIKIMHNRRECVILLYKRAWRVYKVEIMHECGVFIAYKTRHDMLHANAVFYKFIQSGVFYLPTSRPPSSLAPRTRRGGPTGRQVFYKLIKGTVEF